MAYTIVKSDGTVLTTIADGTINTTSTTLGLPGRNYAGYGQSLDTNFVHQLENFAYSSPPASPLKGQLWFNTTANTLNVCPLDGTANANAWLVLTTTSGTGNTTFGNIIVTGQVQSNNISANSDIAGDTINVRLATVRDTANIINANISNVYVGNLTTNLITTGSNTTTGNIIGAWTLNGAAGGNALIVNSGNIYANVGIRVDNISDLSGATSITLSPTAISMANLTVTDTGRVGNVLYVGNGNSANATRFIKIENTNTGSNATATVWNQADGASMELTAIGANHTVASVAGSAGLYGTSTNGTFIWDMSSSTPQIKLMVGSGINPVVSTVDLTGVSITPGLHLQTTDITTGASSTSGNITGNWALTAGSRLTATYADLAERFEADAEYDAGTVVELGGEKEITAVEHDLSDDIFGVVSGTAAYLMNAGAGDDKTHPPVAMSGRVKVNVVGKIKKNDRLVSAGNGKARAAARGEATAFNTIGRSLVDKHDDIAGTVEAIVTIR